MNTPCRANRPWGDRMLERWPTAPLPRRARQQPRAAGRYGDGVRRPPSSWSSVTRLSDGSRPPTMQHAMARPRSAARRASRPRSAGLPEKLLVRLLPLSLPVRATRHGRRAARVRASSAAGRSERRRHLDRDRERARRARRHSQREPARSAARCSRRDARRAGVRVRRRAVRLLRSHPLLRPGHRQRVQVASLPTATSDAAVAALAGTAYVVGGYDGQQALDTIVAWRPGGQPKLVARLPYGLRYAAVAATDGRLLIAGGSHDEAATTTILSFDPATGDLRHIGDLPEPITHAAAVALGSYVYILGGRGSAAGTQSAAIVAVDAATGRSVRDGRLPQPLSDAAAIPVGEDACGLSAGSAPPARSTRCSNSPPARS